MSARPLSAVPDSDLDLDTPTTAPVSWSLRSGLLVVHTTNDAGQWTIALEGEIDRSTIPALEREIAVAEAAQAQSITIDLGTLTFMDSSAVRVLSAVNARVRPPGRLELLPGPRSVQKVFHLTRTESELPFREPAA